VQFMDFSISSKWNASASQATFFEMLSACSASFLADMTRISKGMNHRDCEGPWVYTFVSFRQGCLRKCPISAGNGSVPDFARMNRSESDHVTGQKTGRTTLLTSRRVDTDSYGVEL
jgi:hypothetical protein